MYVSCVVPLFAWLARKTIEPTSDKANLIAQLRTHVLSAERDEIALAGAFAASPPRPTSRVSWILPGSLIATKSVCAMKLCHDWGTWG